MIGREIGLRALDATSALRAAEPGAFLDHDIHMTPRGHAALVEPLACRAELADMAATCPGCGGTGELRSADDRLAAEEPLGLASPTQAGRNPPRRPRKPRTR